MGSEGDDYTLIVKKMLMAKIGTLLIRSHNLVA